MRRLLIRIFRAGVTGGTSFGGQKGESYQIDRVSKFQYKSILSESTGKTRIGRLEEWKGGRLPLSGHSSGADDEVAVILETCCIISIARDLLSHSRFARLSRFLRIYGSVGGRCD